MTTLPCEPTPPLAADPARWWGMGEVVRLAVPSVLNTVSYTAMLFVDRLMVSRLGTEALSAQLVGGITSFTPVCFFMGMLSCVSTFASQNLGAGDRRKAALYGWQGLWVAIAASGLLALLIPIAHPLMRLMGGEESLLGPETEYFQILTGGAVFVLASSSLGAFFLGIHRPIMTLVAGVAGNIVNFIVALVLIFGLVGFPRMGLMGAAIGSIAGSATQMLVLLGPFLWGAIAREYDVRRQCALSWRAILDLVKMGSPAGAMFMGDILMWAIFMGRIIGGFGTEALAAAAILQPYWHLCFMPAIGVSAAVTAIVGRYCGGGQQGLAWRRAHAGLLLVEIYMIAMGLVIWLGRDFFVGAFNDKHDPLVQSIATSAVIFILICQAFDAMNVIFIGALRGAGDTLWPGALQLVLAYGLGLGGSAAVAYYMPQWESLGPWGAASAYIIILGLVMWGRFLRGRWRSIRVVGPAPILLREETAALPPA